MMDCLKIASLLLITILLVKNCAVAETDIESELNVGKNYYDQLQQISENSYGSCWTNAVKNLKMACKKLNQFSQKKLAFELTNCFLHESGMTTCPCENDDAINKCLKSCEDKAFYTYTEFFTHIYSVCHFLEQKNFQVELAKTALYLKANSEKINTLLENSVESQNEMKDLQKNLIMEQQKSIYNTKWLTQQIIKSREHAKFMYKEFHEVTHEQKNLIFRIFDRIRNFERFVLAELMLFYSAFYYGTISVLTYIFTSVQRTSNARVYMFFMILINFIAERTILNYYSLTQTGQDLHMETEMLSHCTWISRYIFCLILLVTLLYYYITYEDVNTLTFNLLKKVYSENREFHAFAREYIEAARQAQPAPILEPQIPAIEPEEDNYLDYPDENQQIVLDFMRKLKNIRKKLQEIALLRQQVDEGLIVPDIQQQQKLDRWDEILNLLDRLELATEF